MTGFFLLGFFLIVIGFPIGGGLWFAHAKEKMKLREKELEVLGGRTVEQIAHYPVQIAALEERVRVLERIVTDRGSELSREIEKLRDQRVD